VFSSIFSQDTAAASNYNSLQASLEKRMSHGLQFELAYTFSKSIDNASSFENIIRPTCDRCNRSLSLFDTKHRVVISYLWELPVPRYEGFKGRVLNDWAVSGITTFQTDFELPGKPNLVAPFHALDPRSHNDYAFNVNAFQLPDSTNTSANPVSLLGNSPRTLCCGPGISNFDVSIQKLLRIGETKRFEFRAEFFNIFNHAQFLNPDGNISDGNFLADGLTPDPNNPGDFGRVKHTRDPRNIQFAVKFAF
jgi:hypothetical protein